MSPNDEKAIKICAKFMGETRPDYDPLESDLDAENLAATIGIEAKPHETVTRHSSHYGQIDVWRGDEVVGRYGNFTTRKAIVYSACDIIKKGFIYLTPQCEK